MSELGKLWAGRVYGTNTGNLFVEFDETEPRVTGTLRFMDDRAGVSVYSVEGEFDGRLSLQGEWRHGGEAGLHGALSVNGRLTSDGNLRGTWESTVGTGGTFELSPHDAAIAGSRSAQGAHGPEQLYARRKTLGAIRLYAKDIPELLRYMSEEFANPKPVVTYQVRGSRVTKYSSDFLQEFGEIGELNYLKILVQEPESKGLNRVVMVELNSAGTNELLVQGTRESWVVGRSEALEAFVARFTSPLVTTYKRFGLNINSVILLAMIIAVPEIDPWVERTYFVVATVAVLLGLYWLHTKFIPNTAIALTADQPGVLGRAWPTVLSWLFAVSASLVAALIFRLLTHGSL